MKSARATVHALLRIGMSERRVIVRDCCQETAGPEVYELARAVAEAVPGIGPSGAIELLARIGWATLVEEELNGAVQK